jgi:hypothetical protein
MGLWDVEAPTISDKRLTDDGEVVSLTGRQSFICRKIAGTHFCQTPSRPQGHNTAGRIRSIEKYLMTSTVMKPACTRSIVPQPTTLRRALYITTSIMIHLQMKTCIDVREFWISHSGGYGHFCRLGYIAGWLAESSEWKAFMDNVLIFSVEVWAKQDSRIHVTSIFRVFFIASGVGLSPFYCGHFWPILPAPDDRWRWLWSNCWNEDWQGKSKYSEKTCPNHFVHHKSHLTRPGIEPGPPRWEASD